MFSSKLRQHLAASRLKDLFLLLVLIPLAILIRVALRFVPMPRLLKIATRLGPRRPRDLDSLVATADLAAAVARRSGRCLLRSVLLFGLVESKVGPVEFFIGVRRDRTNLESHAWIELGGVVLGDQPGVAEDYQVVFRAAHS